ncbi:MAG: hypothetical protein COB09_17040 [Thalassobium sp.]|nr:MAG: hypothetical protein COB09_17040 [Thalassobium sp.]
MTDKVSKAHIAASQAVDQYLEGHPERSAWDMPAEIAKKRGWGWATGTISGRDYAAFVLMFNALVGE